MKLERSCLEYHIISVGQQFKASFLEIYPNKAMLLLYLSTVYYRWAMKTETQINIPLLA